MEEVGGSNPAERVICDKCGVVQSPHANGIICEKCGWTKLSTIRLQEVYVPSNNGGFRRGMHRQ